MLRNIYIIYFVLTLLCGVTQAQTLGDAERNALSGKVVDALSAEGILGVTIVDNTSGNGTITDDEGYFTIALNTLPTKLTIFHLGFVSKEIEVENLATPLKITLEVDPIMVDEVVVKGKRKRNKDEYAWSIHQKVVDHAERNNPDNMRPIAYNDYQRITAFYVKNNRDAKRDTLLAKHTLIPVIMDEKLSLRTRSEGEQGEQVKLISENTNILLESLKSHIDFLANEKATDDFNLYNNQLLFFGRGLPSPLARNASLYYRLYLTDSLSQDGRKEYAFQYFPKSKRSTTFKGSFKVDSTTWALTQIDAEMPETANLNFVSNFKTEIKYEPLEEDASKWFKQRQTSEMDVSFSQNENKSGNRFLHFRLKLMNNFDVISNSESNSESKLIENEDASAEVKREHLLVEEREKVPFDGAERLAQMQIDSLKQKKGIVFLDKLANLGATSFFNVGKIDIGPYYDIFRTTELEGARIGLPLRTSEKFSSKFSIGGHLSYATKAKEVGYGANFMFRVPTKKRFILSAEAIDDYYDLTHPRFMEFVLDNPYSQSYGSSISPITTYEPNPYMLRKRNFAISAEYNFSQDLKLTFRPSYERYFANELGRHYTPYVLFERDGKSFAYFDTQTVLADLRFSKDQDSDDSFFDHIYYDTEKPVFHLSLLAGRYNLQGESSGDYFANLNLSLKWYKTFGPLTFSSLFEAGAIFGDVPYLLLDRAKGSGDYASAEYYFNLLDQASLVSDLYAHAHLSLNMGGIIFNKLPLIKRLNLREVFGFKMYYGALLGKHEQVLDIPSYLYEPSSTPYMEYSAGIGNIFRFFQVEYVASLSDDALKAGYAQRQGVRVQFKLNF